MRHVLQENALTPSDMATLVGVSAPTVYRWINGETQPIRKHLDRICKRLGYNLAWLRAGHGPPKPTGTPSAAPATGGHPPHPGGMGDPIMVWIPDVEASAGDGAQPQAESMHTLSTGIHISVDVARQRYHTPPHLLRTILVRGDSMTPTLMPGQRVMVRLHEGSPLLDGSIYVISGPGGLQVKRLRLQPPHMHILSDNPTAPDLVLSLQEFTDDYRVHAQCLEVAAAL